MLTSFDTEIWTSEGLVLTAAMGFNYPTRMAVIRLKNGSLFIWSPTALTNELRRAVNALGTVAYIVAPNALHHVHLSEWQVAYPEAQVYGLPALIKKRSDITFHAALGDTPAAGWLGEIDQVVLTNVIADEVVFYHAASGTVIFTDLLQNLPPTWFEGWRAVIAKFDLMIQPQAEVPRKFRMGFTNRARTRAGMTKILAWPSRNVLMAHGTPVKRSAQAFLHAAFRWLRR